ncbi:MAG: lipopolysaccharide biosynthesis protein [Pseudonocardiaceae bacterium]
MPFGFVTGCVVGAGLLVNVYLALVARNLPPAEYSYYGAFWSLALIVGFGAFLPVEQELARALHGAGGRRGTMRSAALVAGGLAAAQLALLAAASPLLWPAIGERPATLVALGALCVVSAGQFVVRGVLVGLGRLRAHGLVLLGDAGLRLVFAALVALTASPGSAGFAWALVCAIAVAHLPLLPALLRRIRPDTGPAAAGVRPFATAVAPLLLGSVCAQLLLNGTPVAVSALAGAADQARAGQFLAAFTLARLPLFVVVPLQSAIIPTLTAVATSGGSAPLRRALRRMAGVVLAVGVVGVAVAFVIGPDLVEAIFGAGYRLPATDLALMAAGVTAHLGLILVTQALVAGSRHRDVAWSWLGGLAAAGTVFAVVPDLLLAAELAFLAGSLAGWLIGTTRLPGRHTRRGAEPCATA